MTQWVYVSNEWTTDMIFKLQRGLHIMCNTTKYKYRNILHSENSCTTAQGKCWGWLGAAG